MGNDPLNATDPFGLAASENPSICTNDDDIFIDCDTGEFIPEFGTSASPLPSFGLPLSFTQPPVDSSLNGVASGRFAFGVAPALAPSDDTEGDEGICSNTDIANPPNASIKKNVAQARFAESPVGFYLLVRNGGFWDYKQNGRQFADFGNRNFGATGAALRGGIFSEELLLRAAGFAQVRSGTSLPQFGDPFGEAPFGDDPDDQIQIQRGIDQYNAGCYTPF